MKKILFIAGLATTAYACSDFSKNEFGNKDSAHHAHHDTSSNSEHKDQMNPIARTMDEMMQQMHETPKTGDIDIDFAAMMIEHHKGAVEMSKVEVEKGRDTALKAFAQKVIDDQRKEIEFMQTFISKEKTNSPSSPAFQRAMDSSMMAMMAENVIYNDIDKDFAAQMIPHHQSAVDMAKAYLAYGHEAGLKALCENIIKSQTKEIQWLTDWLNSGRN